jgi:hypothetical protein
MYSVGLLSLEDYRLLTEAASIGNAIAHGFWYGASKQIVAESLLAVSEELLKPLNGAGR